MYTVLGASGHIGSGVVRQLIDRNEPVTAVLRDKAKANDLEALGAATAIVDVLDTNELARVLRRGRRAFLLNPPAPPNVDTNAKELESARSIAAAVQGSGLEKVVVASTYGAMPGDAIGDLSVLYEFEQLINATGVPAAINKGAYYFTNLDMLAEPAQGGTLPASFPEDLVLPMVAPEDLATHAVERLVSDVTDVGLQYVEGPERYSFGDVAEAFESVLGHKVRVQTTPPDELEAAFAAAGFSPSSSMSYAALTESPLFGPSCQSVRSEATSRCEPIWSGS